MLQNPSKNRGNIYAEQAIAMTIEKKPASRERFSISPIGEYYTDLLTIDSWINARTNSAQATSLLCAKLQEREERIKERVAYLAKKRHISPEVLWVQILKGEAVELNPEEIKEVEED